MTQISDSLSELKQTGRVLMRALAPAIEGVLRRAKEARLSPFNLGALGTAGAGAAGAFLYLLASAFVPLGSAVEREPEWRAPVAEAPAQRSLDAGNPAKTHALTRPLFQKSRRAPSKMTQEEAPPAEAQVEAPPAGMALKGVVNQGDDTRVFIVTSALAEGVWLKIGEKLEGWTVESARKSEVTLRKGDRVAHLEFEYDGTPSPPGVGAAGPFPPPQPFRPALIPKGG